MSAKTSLLLAACLFAAVFPVPGGAHTLEEVVVVGRPIIEDNHVDRFASTSTVVTEKQMDDLNAADLGTALRRTPGVNISRYNPIGSFGGAEGGGIFIRGMGASRPGGEIKTFIDGVPMYMGVWNHPLLDLLSIDPAHSLRVHKSPQPQIFGNAFAAINIDPKRRREEGFETDLHLAGGSFGTFIEKAEHGGRTGAVDYFLGQSFRRSDGHRSRADGQLSNYFGRVGAELGSNWDVSLFGLYTDNFARDPGEDGKESATRAGKYATRAGMGVASLGHEYENFEGALKLFVNSGQGDWRDQRPPDKRNLNKFTFSGVRVHEKIRPWADGELTMGLDWDVITGEADFEKRSGAKSGWDGPTQRIFSPYAAFSQLFGDPDGLHVIPSAGLRHYTHSEFDSETAPHAGIIFGYKDTRLHAGYSRGVIYPGLEVVVLSEHVIPRLGKSWRDLEAETLDHYEIGISHTWDRLRADLTFFRDKGKNRYLIVPPPPPPPVYANLGDYAVRGVEATLNFSPTDDLSLFLGAAFLDSDEDKRPYVPASTISAGLNWRFLERFHLSLDAQRVSDMYVTAQARRKGPAGTVRSDGYFLLNGKLAYAVPVDDWKMEIFLAGENLTDSDYEYLPGYPMPGVNGLLGLTLAF